jgi:glutamate synthase domain-containing protein 3
MAQAGRLVVCGDAGHGLGDSIYEARLYVRGQVKGTLGADCVEKPMCEEHVEEVKELLTRAGFSCDPGEFRRYGSARTLYHFQAHNSDAY